MQQHSLTSQCSQWSQLNTNTTFDAGSTQPIDGNTNNAIIVQSVQPTTTSSLLVESLIEQLCKLIEPDSAHQKALYEVICTKLHQMKLIDNTYGIEEFGAIRLHYQREFMHFIQIAKSTIINGNNSQNGFLHLPSPSLEIKRSLTPQETLFNSRYSADFIEVEYLAKGGFGEVYKAKNKLDGEEYAIKKICLCYRNKYYFLRSLREVKLLARLNHPNIVAYKAAWLEPLGPVTKVGHEENSYKSISNAAFPNSREKSLLNTVHSEEDSGGIVFEENSSCVSQEKVNGMDNVCTESGNSNTEGCDKNNGNEASLDSSSQRALCRFKWNEDICSDSFSNEWARLFIQMQLCEGTLRQWLDERNSRSHDVDIQLSFSIFRQIVNGIEYIHSQGIVHHDIKPGNIFVNKEMTCIQVGDLGLACIFQHATQDIRFVNQTVWSLDHRGEIGTKLYAAPEQLKGECNPKSDIYSLGIVLFELIQPFSTDMERSKLLTQLKNGGIPSQLHSKYPQLVQLIKLLIASNPAVRPSAQDLLIKLDLLSEDFCGVFSSNNVSEVIHRLQEDLYKKDLEIEELRRKVQALELYR